MKWIGILILALFGLIPAGAATFHVAPTGDDTASGAATAPWKTLQKAAATLQPGDTALVADGEYAGGVIFRTPGTAAAPITVRALGTGALVRGEQTTNQDAIFVDRASFVILEGLRIERANRAGIRVSLSDHVTIRGCRTLLNARWGIFTDFSDDLLLENNECAFSGTEHGIYISNSGDRPIVRGNKLHDNRGSGVQINADPELLRPDLGAKGDGITTGALIEGNEIWGNGASGGGAINLSSVRDSIIRNNLITGNLAGGVSGFDNGNGIQWGCKNNKVLHNTIHFATATGRYCVSFKNGSTGNVVRGNLLSGGRRGALEFDSDSSLVSDFNLLRSLDWPAVASNEDGAQLFTFAQWQALGQDVHSISADPLFMQVGINWGLQPASPARDKAPFDPLVPTDYLKVARPIGTGFDLGCLEMPLATAPPPPPPPTNPPPPTGGETGATELTVAGVRVQIGVTVSGGAAPTTGERPAAPTDLKVELLLSGTTRYAKVSWKDASANELAFAVQRKVGTGNWTTIGAVPSNSLSFSDWGVRTAGTTYEFRVLALGDAGASLPSPIVAVTP